MAIIKKAFAGISTAGIIMIFFVYDHWSKNVSVFTMQKMASVGVVSTDTPTFYRSKSFDARPACDSKMQISLRKDGHDFVINENSNTGGGSVGLENGQHSCDPSELVTIELRDADEGDKKVIQINKIENNAVSCPREPIVSPFDLPKTGLLSYAGSGNTWTRHLLQQLTGIQTGAVYNDEYLLNNGFPGEGRQDGVIAIKSHVMFRLNNSHSRQIVLIRNPYDSFLAEYKRAILNLGHTGESVTGIALDDNWVRYLRKSMRKWPHFVGEYLRFPHEQHFIIYEDLKNCLDRELLFLALFLKTENLTQFSLCCVLRNNEGGHHRQNSGQSSSIYDLYDKNLRQQMNEMLTEVAKGTEPRFPVLAQRILEYRIED